MLYASLASEQPSLSESKSKRFGIPSPSVSISCPHINSILRSEYGLPVAKFNVILDSGVVVISHGPTLLLAPTAPLGLKLIAPTVFEFKVKFEFESLTVKVVPAEVIFHLSSKSKNTALLVACLILTLTGLLNVNVTELPAERAKFPLLSDPPCVAIVLT